MLNPTRSFLTVSMMLSLQHLKLANLYQQLAQNPVGDSTNMFRASSHWCRKEGIQRRLWTECLPALSQASEDLYLEFLESDDQEIVDQLLHSFDTSRKHTWIHVC